MAFLQRRAAAAAGHRGRGLRRSFIEGNRDGLATVFTTISQPELALLFSPRLGNLVLAEASYSLKPAAVLQTDPEGDARS